MSHKKLYGAPEDSNVNRLGFASTPFEGRSANDVYGQRAMEVDRPKPFTPAATHLDQRPFEGQSESRSNYRDMTREVDRPQRKVPPENLEVPRDSKFDGHTSSESIGHFTGVSHDHSPHKNKGPKGKRFETESNSAYNDRSQRVDRPSPIRHNESLKPTGVAFEGQTESRSSYHAHPGVVRPPAFKPPSEQAELSLGHKFYASTESRDQFVPGVRVERGKPTISKYQDSGDILGHPDSSDDEDPKTKRSQVTYGDNPEVYEYSHPDTPTSQASRTPQQRQHDYANAQQNAAPHPGQQQQQQQYYDQQPPGSSGSRGTGTTDRLSQVAAAYENQSTLPSTSRTEPSPSSNRLY